MAKRKKDETGKDFLKKLIDEKKPVDDKKIQKFDDWDEDYEEFEFEQTPDYEFLKNLYDFLNKKSYPRKSTRKFLRDANDFITKGEVSQKSLDQFIETEGLDKAIVAEMKKKFGKKKPTKRAGNDGGGGGYGRSSC